MQKTLSVLLILAMLLSLGLYAVYAEGWEDEVEFSFDALINPPTPAPPPGATPNPTPEPFPTPEPIYQADGSIEITLTAVGDVTIGRNVQHKGTSIFEKELKKQKNDPNFIFRNVKDIFESDDLTIANFEGVLADTYTIPSSKKNNDFLFLASPEYAQVLSGNGVEAVTMENNHIGDFGEDGINRTITAMENAGVVWSNKNHMGVYEVQGIRIGMLAYQIVPPLRSDEMQADALQAQVASDIAKAKQTCDIVTVSFHWGKELDYAPRD
ncbi:MAG: CapA family protein, partial [Clostridia bacterium]|nr:CapA family protein [Clostridia bacterium]